MPKNVKFDPGAVLDRVIASADPSDSCYLYKLADFRKSGLLVDAFNNGGSKVKLFSMMLKYQASNVFLKS